MRVFKIAHKHNTSNYIIVHCVDDLYARDVADRCCVHPPIDGVRWWKEDSLSDVSYVGVTAGRVEGVAYRSEHAGVTPAAPQAAGPMEVTAARSMQEVMRTDIEKEIMREFMGMKPAIQMRHGLEFFSGMMQGTRHVFGLTSKDILGNRRTADIPVRDSWISWDHAAFYYENGKLTVEDLASKHGVYVSGRKVTKVPVHVGEVIQFGSTQATVIDASELAQTFERVKAASQSTTATSAPAPQYLTVAQVREACHAAIEDFRKNNPPTPQKSQYKIYWLERQDNPDRSFVIVRGTDEHDARWAAAQQANNKEWSDSKCTNCYEVDPDNLVYIHAGDVGRSTVVARVADRYSYSVRFDHDRDEFVATVEEFPAIEGSSYILDYALAEVREKVSEHVRDLISEAKGEPVICPPYSTLRTFYVSCKGDDANDGLSPNNPKRSVFGAYEDSRDGDTIRLGPGALMSVQPKGAEPPAWVKECAASAQAAFEKTRAGKVATPEVRLELAKEPVQAKVRDLPPRPVPIEVEATMEVIHGFDPGEEEDEPTTCDECGNPNTIRMFALDPKYRSSRCIDHAREYLDAVTAAKDLIRGVVTKRSFKDTVTLVLLIIASLVGILNIALLAR